MDNILSVQFFEAHPVLLTDCPYKLGLLVGVYLIWITFYRSSILKPTVYFLPDCAYKVRVWVGV